MESVKYDVVVRKNFPLFRGENVGEAMSVLREQGSEFLYKKLATTAKDTGIYMVEAFSTAAVFETYKRGDDNSPGPRYRFYAVSFSRDKNTGSYEFSASQEVKRVVRFEPKTAEPPSFAKTSKAKNERLEGWEKVSKSKSLFNGVV